VAGQVEEAAATSWRTLAVEGDVGAADKDDGARAWGWRRCSRRCWRCGGRLPVGHAAEEEEAEGRSTEFTPSWSRSSASWKKRKTTGVGSWGAVRADDPGHRRYRRGPFFLLDGGRVRVWFFFQVGVIRRGRPINYSDDNIQVFF